MHIFNLEISTQTFFLILFLSLFIAFSLYQRAKNKCLMEACKLIAEAEEYSDLTGKEKFNLVLKWIDERLPKIYKVFVVQAIIANIIQYCFDNSFDYMKNYVENKAGISYKELSKIKEEKEEEIEKDKTEEEFYI